MKSWHSHLHRFEPWWQGTFPVKIIWVEVLISLRGFIRLLGWPIFANLSAPGHFRCPIYPIYPIFVHQLVRFINFRPLCPKSIILVIQGRLRVDRIMWIFLHLIMNGGNNEEFFYGWKWWKLHNQSMGHFQPAIINTIRFRKRPIFEQIGEK